MLKIRPAQICETDELSKLVMRSKSHWPYPADYLSKCVEVLKIDIDYILNWPVFVGEIDNTNIGLFTLKVIDGEKRLDNLWVDPPFIGKGFGKQLFFRAVEEAKKLNWENFRLAADPYALDFYLKRGGRQIGSVQSRIKPDLFLPHIEFIF